MSALPEPSFRSRPWPVSSRSPRQAIMLGAAGLHHCGRRGTSISPGRSARSMAPRTRPMARRAFTPSSRPRRGDRQEARGSPDGRRRVTTTKRDPDHRPANDLVRRNFFVEKPNELWVVDITFVPTLAGLLFLAVVLDAWSRRIVGWAFSADLKTRVVLDALDMALAARKPKNVIHHSDQGSQGGFNRSSQHDHHTAERGTDRVPRSVFSIPAFCEAACSSRERRRPAPRSSAG